MHFKNFCCFYGSGQTHWRLISFALTKLANLPITAKLFFYYFLYTNYLTIIIEQTVGMIVLYKLKIFLCLWYCTKSFFKVNLGELAKVRVLFTCIIFKKKYFIVFQAKSLYKLQICIKWVDKQPVKIVGFYVSKILLNVHVKFNIIK